MRRRALIIACMVAVVVIAVLAGPASAHRPDTGASREAAFAGEAVVPPPGDPDGAGTAQLILYPGKEKLCYRLNVSNVDGVTAAHLHRGGAGETGPVVRTLIPPNGSHSRECVKRYGKKAVRRIANNLSDYYIDVHTDEHPNGAVGAQFSG